MTRDERIAKIRGGCWIRYSRAEEITARLDHLLQLPTMHRMPNLLIIGETNNGKTALVNHFLAQHRAQLGGSGTPSCIPLVAVQAPSLPDERRFYQAILAQVFAPFRPPKTAGNLQFEVVQLLSTVGVKMLIVDEIQHVLAGPMLKQRHFLNVIKFIWAMSCKSRSSPPARTMRSTRFRLTPNVPIASSQRYCGVGR
jgi:hypothetical protein